LEFLLRFLLFPLHYFHFILSETKTDWSIIDNLLGFASSTSSQQIRETRMMESFVNYSTPLSVDLKSFDTPLLETEFRVICHAFVPSENLKGSVLPWRLTLQRVPGATIRCAVRHLIFFPLCLDSEVFSQI